MSENLDMDYDLDMLGVLCGTDKSSSYKFAWDYLRHYEELFRSWRETPINLLEIGVADGASLNVWQSYFTAATIVGIDINPQCARLSGGRAVVEIGSQVDPGFLHRVAAKYPPTIVIDDGSHQAEHIIYSFERLFPALEPGGVYIVEDVTFHFQPRTTKPRSANGVSVPDYFLDMGRSCLARALPEAANGATPMYVLEQVDSVLFFHSAIVIKKKKPRDTRRALRFAETYVGGGEVTGPQYGRLAQYISSHNGPLAQAEQMARRAVDMTNYDPGVVDLLSRILSRLQRADEAAEVLTRALSIHKNNGMLLVRLGSTEFQRKNYAKAVEVHRILVGLHPNDPGAHDQLSQTLEQMGEIREACSAAEHAAEIERDETKRRRLLDHVEQLRAKLA